MACTRRSTEDYGEVHCPGATVWWLLRLLPAPSVNWIVGGWPFCYIALSFWVTCPGVPEASLP